MLKSLIRGSKALLVMSMIVLLVIYFLNTFLSSHISPKKIKPEIKTILLWTDFFGGRYDEVFPAGVDQREIFCPEKCLMSRSKMNPETYDALIFHARDPQNPPAIRKDNQIYVALLWESPIYRGSDFIQGYFYNWSATHVRESTIRLVNGFLHGVPAHIPSSKLPQMKKDNPKRKNGSATIAWIVSNCSPTNGRKRYVKQLQSYMLVDIHGKCGKRCPRGKERGGISCYLHIAATGKYKFYLAFENGNCKDYITMKSFRALEAGMVPIVMGGLSGEDYNGVFPPNSYIDVRDFKTVKQLAEYLMELDRDDEKYLKLHAWRANYSMGLLERDVFYCQVCTALYDETLMSKPRSLDFGKFYDPKTMCEDTLVNRLLGD